MPYKIVKMKGGYGVKNIHTGKIKNDEPMTHKKAKAYLWQLENAEGIGKTDAKRKKKGKK